MTKTKDTVGIVGRNLLSPIMVYMEDAGHGKLIIATLYLEVEVTILETLFLHASGVTEENAVVEDYKSIKIILGVFSSQKFTNALRHYSQINSSKLQIV